MTTTAMAAGAAPSSRTRHLTTALRILLGLLFVASGLVGLLGPRPSLTSPPMPAAVVAFVEGMVKSGYLLPLLKLTETGVGLLLVSNRFVPLALTILAPVVVNIVAFHLFLERAGLPVALAILAVHLFLAWQYREHFRPMLEARGRPGGGYGRRPHRDRSDRCERPERPSCDEAGTCEDLRWLAAERHLKVS